MVNNNASIKTKRKLELKVKIKFAVKVKVKFQMIVKLQVKLNCKSGKAWITSKGQNASKGQN